jgi:hypothetical protein
MTTLEWGTVNHAVRGTVDIWSCDTVGLQMFEIHAPHWNVTWCNLLQLRLASTLEAPTNSWISTFNQWRDNLQYILFNLCTWRRGPLSLVSTIEELLGRKSSGSGLEIREYGRSDPSCWARGNLYQQKLALTSPINGGHSVGRVRSRTQATEFSGGWNCLYSSLGKIW